MQELSFRRIEDCSTDALNDKAHLWEGEGGHNGFWCLPNGRNSCAIHAWSFWPGTNKKQGQYWPQSVPGNDIDDFEGKELGEMILLEQKIKGINF